MIQLFLCTIQSLLFLENSSSFEKRIKSQGLSVTSSMCYSELEYCPLYCRSFGILKEVEILYSVECGETVLFPEMSSRVWLEVKFPELDLAYGNNCWVLMNQEFGLM